MSARPSIRVGIVVTVAVIAGAVIWLTGRNDGKKTAASSTANVSAQSLRALTAAIGRPIYWAGPQGGVSYEFTETSDRRAYVRYLPAGVHAGSTKPFLTVGSYQFANAYQATADAARRPGAVTVPVKGDAVAFYSKTRPTNVYMAFPRENVQVEVFDPSAAKLHRLVRDGLIVPVSANARAVAVQTQPVRSSPAGLKRLAGHLSRPVFWLGAMHRRTLELSRSPDGRVYVRYLPAGVAVGARRPALSVGSYPLASAFAATKAAARAAGTVRIRMPGGAIAFYAKARPTNVYVAFPGVDEQVEVYDPSGGGAQRLVAAGRVVPVSS